MNTFKYVRYIGWSIVLVPAILFFAGLWFGLTRDAQPTMQVKPKVETPKPVVPKVETPKAEVKEPKVEVKAETPKPEAKPEPPTSEVKAEEPKIETVQDTVVLQAVLQNRYNS